MATKRVCDRCGAEINPFNSVTYAGMRRVKTDINDNDYELCGGISMTNADCIRNMNDEELARFLDEVQRQECEALHEIRPDGSLKFYSCQYGWLRWLKKEAKEDG